MSKSLTLLLVAAAALSLLGYGLARLTAPSGFGMVPALVVLGGVAGLLLLLIAAGVAYQYTGIADARQAFALPEGSIRAVVATMALLLFGIIPLFLYATQLNAPIDHIPGLSWSDAVAFRKQLTDAYVGPDLPAAAPGTATTYTVYFKNIPGQAATDLAKQFFMALSTLVSAVSSFFFGSAVATSATKAGVAAASSTASPMPRLTTAQPSSAQAPPAGASPTDQRFVLSGSGLDMVVAVDLQQGTAVAHGTDVTSNPSVVQFVLPIQPGMQGAWTVIASTSDHKQARLENGIQVT